MENCQVSRILNPCLCVAPPLVDVIIHFIELLCSNPSQLFPGAFHPTRSRSVSQTSPSSAGRLTTLNGDQLQLPSGSDTAPPPTPPVPLVLPTKHTLPPTNQPPFANHVPTSFSKMRDNSVTTTETDDSARPLSSPGGRISRRRRRARGNIGSVGSSPISPVSPPLQSTSPSTPISEGDNTIPPRPVFSQYTPPRLLGSNPMPKPSRVRNHIYSEAVRAQRVCPYFCASDSRS